jgi:hypothetical protein
MFAGVNSAGLAFHIVNFIVIHDVKLPRVEVYNPRFALELWRRGSTSRK